MRLRDAGLFGIILANDCAIDDDGRLCSGDGAVLLVRLAGGGGRAEAAVVVCPAAAAGGRCRDALGGGDGRDGCGEQVKEWVPKVTRDPRPSPLCHQSGNIY